MDGCVPRPLPHPPVARQIKDVIRQQAREFGVPPSRIALTGGAAQQDFRDFEAGRSAVLAQRDETKFLGSMGSDSPDRNTKDQSETNIGVLTNG